MNILETIKLYFFSTLVALAALSVSASAAFYSVTGLSKLFAGASLEVIIMASSLEVSKLIIASLLYNYWDSINNLLKSYLTVALVVLVLITSMGIYGFLSSAYQETATKSQIIDKEIAVLELKKKRYEEDRDYNLEEKENISNSISELRKGLSNNVVQYKDSSTGKIITTQSSSNRKTLQSQLDKALASRAKVLDKIELSTDSISSLDIKILEIESQSDVASELGPLEYLSGLTGKSMDLIINVLLLVIIFVFDPLAISLVVAANFVFTNVKNKPKQTEQEENQENIEEEEEDDIESFVNEEEDQEDIDEEEIREIEEQISEQEEKQQEAVKKKLLMRLKSIIKGFKN